MTWIQSDDGTTPGRERGSLPSQLQRHPETGEWTQMTPDNASDWGVYPVTPTARPGDPYVRTVENVPPGTVGSFAEVWTFSQELEDQQTEEENRRQAGQAAANRSAWFYARAGQWRDAPPADDQQSIMDQLNAMHLDLERAHTQLADITLALAGYPDVGEATSQEDPPDDIERDRKRKK